MKLDSEQKGFFIPTVMIYIIMFISLITYSVYQTVGYKIMATGFEENLYFELGLKEAEQSVAEFLNNNKNYDKICPNKGDSYVESIEQKNYKYNINYYCIKLPVQIAKILNSKNLKLEMSYENYKKEVNFLKKNSDKNLDELLKLVVKIFIPEMSIVVKGVDSIEDIALDEYFIFDIDLKTESKNEQLLIYYNTNQNEIKWITHT